ncbi:hypothetical protein CRG98_044941 [Punica granatum]|uniref:Uncharacterized protein n=1 Tax=Punica granatum TaxID=22663 RepID=A0A2I0HSL0_PUNGR|nr:hypothetical protein CRG98_044941 [Punica granatum]
MASAQKDKAKAPKQITRATKEGNPKNRELGWWEQPLDELTLPEVAKAALAMEAFPKDICSYLNHSKDLDAPNTRMVKPFKGSTRPCVRYLISMVNHSNKDLAVASQ